MRASRRHGFTLIELLVVIAIIAILAAILFPVFATARARARAASCLANVKQFGLAYLMYTDDYDGAFPSVCIRWPNANLSTGFESMSWMENLNTYIKNANMWNCPSAPAFKIVYANNPSWPWWYGGYALNYEHAMSCASHSGSVGGVKNPSKVITLCDGQTAPTNCLEGSPTGSAPGGNANYPTGAFGWMAIHCPIEYPNGACGPTSFLDPINDPPKYPDYPAPYAGISSRHNGGGNYVFMDGHARWMKATAVASLTKPGEELWGHYDQ